MTDERRKLTAHEKACAARLKAMWFAKRNKEGLTQQDIAEFMGMSASAIGQYLNGKIPLNLKVIVKFAKYFNCDVSEIDPSDPLSNTLSDDEKKLILAFRSSGARQKSMLLDVAALALHNSISDHKD